MRSHAPVTSLDTGGQGIHFAECLHSVSNMHNHLLSPVVVSMCHRRVILITSQGPMPRNLKDARQARTGRVVISDNSNRLPSWNFPAAVARQAPVPCHTVGLMFSLWMSHPAAHFLLLDWPETFLLFCWALNGFFLQTMMLW